MYHVVALQYAVGAEVQADDTIQVQLNVHGVDLWQWVTHSWFVVTIHVAGAQRAMTTPRKNSGYPFRRWQTEHSAPSAAKKSEASMVCESASGNPLFSFQSIACAVSPGFRLHMRQPRCHFDFAEVQTSKICRVPRCRIPSTHLCAASFFLSIIH